MRKILSFPFELMAYFFGALFGISLVLMSTTRHGISEGLIKIEKVTSTLSDSVK